MVAALCHTKAPCSGIPHNAECPACDICTKPPQKSGAPLINPKYVLVPTALGDGTWNLRAWIARVSQPQGADRWSVEEALFGEAEFALGKFFLLPRYESKDVRACWTKGLRVAFFKSDPLLSTKVRQRVNDGEFQTLASFNFDNPPWWTDLVPDAAGVAEAAAGHWCLCWSTSRKCWLVLPRPAEFAPHRRKSRAKEPY